MIVSSLIASAEPYLTEVSRWLSQLRKVSLQQAAPDPAKAAILSVDVINGFCYEGPLASPRVAAIVEPIRRLFQTAWDYGLRQIVLIQDTHDPQAVEFGQFAPHCIRGTSEAEAVPEIKQLPFYDQLIRFEKNSIHPAYNTGLENWLREHSDLTTFIVVGDCTDLCTYQLAMTVKLHAHAHQLTRRVIVPENCVDTYDLPLETARQIGALPHPAELLHAVFLHHMALNGIEVVNEIRSDD